MNRYSFRNKDDRNKDETSIRYAREKDREIRERDSDDGNTQLLKFLVKYPERRNKA